MDKLETKIDDGFADVKTGFAEMRTQIVFSERALRTEILSVRSEGRSDFRTMLAAVVAPLWTATSLAMVGVIASHV